MSKDRDDFDANEWGNLGDDNRLLDPKLNYKIAAKDRMADPNTRKKLKESRKKQNTDAYLDHMSKQRFASMDKPIDETGITLREKLTIANQKSAKDPIAYKNRVKANRETQKTKQWKDAHAKGVLNYSEAVITPHGEYQSMSAWMQEHNKPGGRILLKSLPHLFYKVEDGPGKQAYETICNTPYGVAITTRHAKELAMQNKEPNAIKMKNVEGWWLKMCVQHSKDYYRSYEVAVYWPLEKSYPHGALDVEYRRIKFDDLQKNIDQWNMRLEKHKLVYKKGSI